jgi:hypothetical protein
MKLLRKEVVPGSGDKGVPGKARFFVERVANEVRFDGTRLPATEWAERIAARRGCSAKSVYQRLATLPRNGQSRVLWGSTWRRVKRPVRQ